MTITTASLLEISLIMQHGSSAAYNVWQYGVDAMLGTPSAPEIGAAWWAAVGTAYRDVALTGYPAQFLTVRVRDMSDALGDYGEFPVPTDEQHGTRTLADGYQYATSFIAAGVRLAVATRVTRPGQKRIPFVYEGDLDGNALESGITAKLETLFDIMAADLTLGSPALGTILQPIVVSKDTTGAVVASQPVVGYVINTFATSQVSRKFGRGV